jgi:uncharacterized protein (DUF433 family)
MPAVNRSQQIINDDVVDAEQMIGPDVHRPGPARARLIAEQIPVWAVIGYLQAVAGASDLSAITDETIDQAAVEYDITIEAVLAALRYYREHRGAIDGLLEANAAALA